MTCGFEMNPWIRNSSLSNYCFNFSRLILSHCTSLSQVALFWLLASLDLSRYGFQLSSTRFDSKQYGLLQSNQYRFAAKQAVQFCCKASSTGRFAAKQAVQVCCNASCKASSTGLLQSKVCCKARSTGLLQSKQYRKRLHDNIYSWLLTIHLAHDMVQSTTVFKMCFIARQWTSCLWSISPLAGWIQGLALRKCQLLCVCSTVWMLLAWAMTFVWHLETSDLEPDAWYFLLFLGSDFHAQGSRVVWGACGHWRWAYFATGDVVLWLHWCMVHLMYKGGAHRRDPNDALLLMETEAMQQNKRVNDCGPMNARMCELHSSPLRWTWKPKARLTLMCTWFETLANNCLSTWTLHHVWWSGECLQGCTPKSQNCHFPTPLSPTPLSPQKRETWPWENIGPARLEQTSRFDNEKKS